MIVSELPEGVGGRGKGGYRRETAHKYAGKYQPGFVSENAHFLIHYCT